MVTLNKIFTFDMAHALEHYPGKCRHIHGHTYILHVSVNGEILNKPGAPLDGMIADFTDIKQWVKGEVIDVFDHALVLRQNSEHANMNWSEQNWTRIIITPYQPTCENIMLDIRDRLNKKIPSGLELVQLRLYETPTSYAEWKK
ncbi:MAG: 6-pyruvoyl trahydropterin synthase family protein [Bacteroidota bacterium]